MSVAASETTALEPSGVRARIRKGWSGLTTGLAPGYLQGNLVILPSDEAEEFVQFCENNSQACPILAVGAPGDFRIPSLAADLDLRTDIGGYLVHRNGQTTEVSDLKDIWRKDFVGIVLGCWFSAEGKLRAAGIRMRHLELGIQGGLFKTTVSCKPSGRFQTNLVVSMRPFNRRDVDKVTQITSQLPLAHGAPVHVGDPSHLGIQNLGRPDFGEEITPLADEVPIYWACGLTSGAALAAARTEIAITHVPGRMVVTDLPA